MSTKMCVFKFISFVLALSIFFIQLNHTFGSPLPHDKDSASVFPNSEPDHSHDDIEHIFEKLKNSYRTIKAEFKSVIHTVKSAIQEKFHKLKSMFNVFSDKHEPTPTASEPAEVMDLLPTKPSTYEPSVWSSQWTTSERDVSPTQWTSERNVISTQSTLESDVTPGQTMLEQSVRPILSTFRPSVRTTRRPPSVTSTSAVPEDSGTSYMWYNEDAQNSLHHEAPEEDHGISHTGYGEDDAAIDPNSLLPGEIRTH